MLFGILLTYYLTNLTMDSEVRQIEVDKLDEIKQSYEIDEILYNAFWEVFEGKSDWTDQKGLAVDFSNYNIINLQVNSSWFANNLAGGNMDVIMKNKESGLYDWLAINLLLADKKLVNMELALPNYYKDFTEAHNDKQIEIEQFVKRVFNTMAPLHFGYRYRSSLSIPIKWNIENVEIVGANSNRDMYLVEVNYAADYADSHKLFRALLVIKHHENRKYQIEDIHVIG